MTCLQPNNYISRIQDYMESICPSIYAETWSLSVAETLGSRPLSTTTVVFVDRILSVWHATLDPVASGEVENQWAISVATALALYSVHGSSGAARL